MRVADLFVLRVGGGEDVEKQRMFIEWKLKTEQHSKQTLLVDWFSNLSFQVIFGLSSEKE